jgi:transcriptional regulator with XRE-family HTH domain
MKPVLNITHHQHLKSLATADRQVPSWIVDLQPGELVRLLRQQLHMTQSQLAGRSGVPQAKIARIETGKIDFRISTLKRLLEALGASPILLAHRNVSGKEMCRKRARAVAERNVGRILGTSALEAQQPRPANTKAMIREEERRLLEKNPSELWNEL